MNPDGEGAWRARNKLADSPYKRWQKEEGIPVYRGSFVDNLHTLEVAPWSRLGQKGAFVNLADQEEDDGWLIEIAPGGQTEVLHHAFEASTYVADGRGATTFWQHPSRKQTVEWQRGSIFSPPINCSYQHYNLDGHAPARLFSVTTAPMVMNLYRNQRFVFENPFVFDDRYAAQDDFFTDPGRAVASNWWRTNFIPDIRSFGLADSERGVRDSGMQFVLSNNQSVGHCSAFPQGTYKRAHRHGVGAHVIILDGQGYSLLWFEEGEERRRVDWQDGTVISPKEWEYHQHFNTGPGEAKYLAFRLGDLDTRRPEPGRGWNTREEVMGIPYEQEDPAIYDLYAEECPKHGATVRMPRPSYARA